MIKRKCRKCGELHQVFKTIFKNETKHLFIVCEKFTGKARIYIPYENVDLPIIESKKRKQNAEEKTASLFV